MRFWPQARRGRYSELKTTRTPAVVALRIQLTSLVIQHRSLAILHNAQNWPGWNPGASQSVSDGSPGGRQAMSYMGEASHMSAAIFSHILVSQFVIYAPHFLIKSPSRHTTARMEHLAAFLLGRQVQAPYNPCRWSSSFRIWSRALAAQCRTSQTGESSKQGAQHPARRQFQRHWEDAWSLAEPTTRYS